MYTVVYFSPERGKGVDATQEMLALGVSNIAGAFIGSIPTSGSFTRSAINNTSGVKTPFGGFFTGRLSYICRHPSVSFPLFHILDKYTY